MLKNVAWCGGVIPRKSFFLKFPLSKISEYLELKKLETLDAWEWEPKKDSWEKSYKELVDFVKKNNRIPTKPRDNLGDWVTRQRSSYRQKKLSLTRTKKLESIKGWKWEIN